MARKLSVNTLNANYRFFLTFMYMYMYSVQYI